MTRTTRHILALLAACTAALAYLAPAALASTPETPEVTAVIEIHATSAYVRGILNPNAVTPGEAGTYQFVYRPSTKSECKGTGETKLPETPGITMGLEREETPFEPLTGLTPGTEYAICLIATETGKTEPATSAPFTFKTPVPPETPETNPATSITGTTATLNATLNPNKPAEPGEQYKFYYQESPTECQGPGSKEEPQFSLLPATGAQKETVTVNLTNLLPRTKYTFCAWVANGAEESAIGITKTFETTEAAPTISGTSYTGLTSSEVTLMAEVSPGGAPTTYQIEYETGSLTDERELAASRTPVSVSQTLTGLQPNTEYHARLLAHNEKGDAEAPITFKTNPSTSSKAIGSHDCSNSKDVGFSSALPDCRAAELVTPAEEHGETYDPGGTGPHEEDDTTTRPVRSASDGAAVAYIADPGPVGGEGASAKGLGNEYLARRGPLSGPAGWETTNITPPVGEGESASFQKHYEQLSPDLSAGVVTAGEPLIGADPSPPGPAECSVLYSNELNALGGAYRALFNETLTPGECGSLPGAGSNGRDHTLVFAGETGDHSQKLLQSPAPLVKPAVATVGVGGNLYDSSDGSLSVVNVLPGGEVDPHATYGGPSGLPNNAPDFSGVIASDGSRVFWSSVEQGESYEELPVARPAGLYAREDPTSPSATTIQLDVPESGATGTAGGGQFWAASEDGSKVFFTDCSRLTTTSTAVSSEGCRHVVEPENELNTGNDLYEYDFDKPIGERLVDLTVDGSDPLGADVQGVVGVSEDGTYVYFIAGGTLTDEANSRGELAETRSCVKVEGSTEGEGRLPAGVGCNLYEIHDNGTEWEKPIYITALAKNDDTGSAQTLNDPLGTQGGVELVGDWAPDMGSRTAEVSADGQHVVFESTQQLTGYEIGDVGGYDEHHGGTEVFIYDATTRRLACASCNPEGVPPVAGIQASVSGVESYLPVSSSNTYMKRWMNTEGTEVFFNSSQPLVTGDGNNSQDVYEWEQEGSASCPTATSTYGGCVYLLSNGEGQDFSYFVDADEKGENVFLTHRGPLYGAGPSDEKAHLYDLRVGGGFPESSLACTGTGCQGVPPGTPSFATPASATFAGAGNFPPPATVKKNTKKTVKCTQNFVKRKVKNRETCVKKPKKKKNRAKKSAHIDRRVPR